jgi:tetratricopeptide (TPR) repeat protein
MIRIPAMAVLGLVLGILMIFGGGRVWGAPTPEEAQRFFTRGLTAVEMAHSPADFAAAARELEKAKQIAPHWPEVYFNLGLIYKKSGKYDLAINNLRGYLKLVPEAKDAGQVREAIYRLEFLRERSNIAGVWKADATAGKVSCTPSGYLVTGGTGLSSHFPIDDLQLEITSGPQGDQARILSSRFRFGALLKDAPFTALTQTEKGIFIDRAVMYTCGSDTMPDLCPWEVRLELEWADDDTLTGRILTSGIGKDAVYEWGRVKTIQCTGSVILRRQER